MRAWHSGSSRSHVEKGMNLEDWLASSQATWFVEHWLDDLIYFLGHQETPVEWSEQVKQLLLASDRVDAMTKLRLAARWAEVKA
jgi:hypothetical protein